MGLAFATFSVSEDKPQNRLQLSFTLVLTTITFKFIVNQSLPKISYLTYLVSAQIILLFRVRGGIYRDILASGSRSGLGTTIELSPELGLKASPWFRVASLSHGVVVTEQ